MNSRRDFIKGIGKLAAVAGLAPLAVLCKTPKPAPRLPPIETWRLTLNDPEPGGRGRRVCNATFYFDNWSYPHRVQSIQDYAKTWYPAHHLERAAALDDNQTEVDVWVMVAGNLRTTGPITYNQGSQRRVICDFSVNPPGQTQWQNFTAPYTDVNKAELINRMVKAVDKVEFRPPKPAPKTTPTSPPTRDPICIDEGLNVVATDKRRAHDARAPVHLTPGQNAPSVMEKLHSRLPPGRSSRINRKGTTDGRASEC